MTPEEIDRLKARLSALERECKAWRDFVPAFSEQEPGWTDKMLEVAAARAATGAIAGEM